MPDCDNPKCHEHMTTELASKVSRKRFDNLRDCVTGKMPKVWVWFGFILIGLPLLVTGAKVWSQQESDNLRFASKDEVVSYRVNQTKLKAIVDHVSQDIVEIKTSQQETQKDVKEILRYMRNDRAR